VDGIPAHGRGGFFELNLYPLGYHQAVAKITTRLPARILFRCAAPGRQTKASRCAGYLTRAIQKR
jgi:hypothetical protein